MSNNSCGEFGSYKIEMNVVYIAKGLINYIFLVELSPIYLILYCWTNGLYNGLYLLYKH